MGLPRILHYIDGAMVEPVNGGWMDDVEPATGAPYAALADGDAADVDLAVAAASRTFDDWSRTPAGERSVVMLRIADLMERDLERLARAESIDAGKPIALARRLDIPRAIANMRFFATAILHQSSELYTREGVALDYVLRRPRGVAGLISPWNLPLYLFTWKVAPAIASGCTAVAKPSEITPMTASLFGELCIEAGLPAGVLNIVQGRGPTVGEAITTHDGIKTISFTGGTATGARIAANGAPRFKKLSLELGGKNPTLVFADVDLDTVVPGTLRAAFENTGQICLCGPRLFVQQDIADEFTERFVEAAAALRVGDPLDDETQQGALVSQQHYDKVTSYVDLAKEEGGTIATGGGRPVGLPERCNDGFFLQPTVVTGLDWQCRVNQEEIFGPVVSIIPFGDEEEAVTWANSTPYGLASSVWTNDLKRAHRVAEAIDTGIVWVNTWLSRDLRVPFGGMKQSGVGREGGEEALHFFTEAKTVTIAIDS
jgi:aminomuconate-semialdehyde/2-hydroxymuconate-6-semialdehyde dehydrogenase